MCQSAAEGGRRCPSSAYTSTPERRSAERVAKTTQRTRRLVTTLTTDDVAWERFYTPPTMDALPSVMRDVDAKAFASTLSTAARQHVGYLAGDEDGLPAHIQTQITEGATATSVVAGHAEIGQRLALTEIREARDKDALKELGFAQALGRTQAREYITARITPPDDVLEQMRADIIGDGDANLYPLDDFRANFQESALSYARNDAEGHKESFGRAPKAWELLQRYDPYRYAATFDAEREHLAREYRNRVQWERERLEREANREQAAEQEAEQQRKEAEREQERQAKLDAKFDAEVDALRQARDTELAQTLDALREQHRYHYLQPADGETTGGQTLREAADEALKVVEAKYQSDDALRAAHHYWSGKSVSWTQQEWHARAVGNLIIYDFEQELKRQRVAANRRRGARKAAATRKSQSPE